MQQQRRRSIATKTNGAEQASSGAKKKTQSADERRQIRSNYRQLITELSTQKEDFIRPGSDALAKKLQQSDLLFHRVQQPREAALDSECMTICSRYGAEQAARLKTHFGSYDVGSFMVKLRLFMQGATSKDKQKEKEKEKEEEEEEEEENGSKRSKKELDWLGFGLRCAKYYRLTPTVDFLHGPLSATPKEKKQRRVTQKEKLGKKVVPEEIKDTSKEEEGETSKRVEQLYNQLRKTKRQNVFSLIADPSSFSRTVENLFHLSFLVKEGRAETQIAQTEEGPQPILKPALPPDDSDYESGTAYKRQCVVKLDYKMWQEMIRRSHHSANGSTTESMNGDSQQASDGDGDGADGDGGTSGGASSSTSRKSSNGKRKRD